MILLVDGTGDFSRAAKFVSRVRAAAPGAEARVFRDDARDFDLSRETGAGPVLSLSCIFQSLNGPSTRGVILVANGSSGRQRPDIAAEVHAGEMLAQNGNAALGYLRVGHGKKSALDEMIESIAAMPGLRSVPARDLVPDPGGVPRALARLSLRLRP